MNKSKLKSYAPQARKDFISAVTARAHQLGLDEEHGQLKVAPAQTQGDVTIIAGQAWPAKVDAQRQQLIARMQREGFAHTVEAVAYTWFNRFAALRYMELHDYLGHGHRALSSREGGLPEMLAQASELAQGGDLPGLKASQVNELKLAGNRDGELYRLLLIAQCNALHQAMPFLFEHIDDETELLLPDNLLLSDSVISKLVAEVPEEDWAEVEIIGWLYQFYISEKKDQVIGKVVKSEDIPAATQLFTPNWIVQYLVQNSVGRLWLMANPDSTLASQWPYYIQTAEQTPEAQAQLDGLIQTRIHEDGETLDPETITVLDPACGSGHILVVAYDLLKAIYLERGYQPRAIPRLILEKNLYGLDIDDRAAQLAGFALLMKARADDRRLFIDPPRLNVLSLQSSARLNYEELCTHLAPFNVQRHTIWGLIETFEHAKTFGSLIQIPYALKTHLSSLSETLALVLKEGDLYASAAAAELLPLVLQARVLAMQFDSVAANPPYMGAKAFTAVMKDWLKENFPANDKDLFSAFIERISGMCKKTGHYGIMTSFVWMFIVSFEKLRKHIIQRESINSLIQLHYDAFADAKAHICAFISQPYKVTGFKSSYIRLADFPGIDQQAPKTLEAINNRNCDWFYEKNQDEFNIIPGSPIAYWLKNTKAFSLKKLESHFISGGRTKTHGNEKYLRYWWEPSELGDRWKPYATSGDFRKYFGNLLQVIDWSEPARVHYHSHGGLYPEQFWGKEGITWGKITSTRVSFRLKPDFAHYDSGAGSIFSENFKCDDFILGYLNSPIVDLYLKAMNPTVNTTVNDVFALPLPPRENEAVVKLNVRRLVDLARWDWNEYEISSDFCVSPLAKMGGSLLDSFSSWTLENEKKILEFKSAEEESNSSFINSMKVTEDVSPLIPVEQVSLTVNPKYRYGIDVSDRERTQRFTRDTAIELVSYAIGCMMGRYSLDEPGLIYAHAGNVGFDPSRYEKKFPVDADGIVSLTDEPWFTDDAASRVRDFLRAVWGADTLEENMAWLAESLGVKGSKTPDETTRRYLADKFFKDHLQTYKKRPIYWLFSSGKQGAFQSLVYLHRYHEGTLARLRAEYVVPLTGKMQARLDMLDKDAQAATSTAARNKISKEIEKLKKKHLELLAYDEKLRHHADMRITLDLDDGVKVNYGKFGDLLAEVKAVTGGKEDE